MAAPSTCICTLNIYDILAATASNCELVAELRKSFIQGSANLVISRPKRATAVAGVCTLTLTRTATEGAKVSFTLNYNDGGDYRSISFDPITIPNSSTVDLATLLSVSKG